MMAIIHRQLYYIWNELQSRYGVLTSYIILEGRKHRALIQIMNWEDIAFDLDVEAQCP